LFLEGRKNVAGLHKSDGGQTDIHFRRRPGWTGRSLTPAGVAAGGSA